MKKILLSFTLLITLIGCEEESVKTVVKSQNKADVVTTNGFLMEKRELTEFDYRGHRYVSCNVRDGIALTHAGHCWCNPIKNKK